MPKCLYNIFFTTKFARQKQANTSIIVYFNTNIKNEQN